jgi:SWI/SNF-related matrix-associated actin-dependent regulator 1 of chromatin subfamily A
LNPGAWGKYYAFACRYADGRDGAHGFVADGSSNEEEFRLRMREVMIRRTWPEVVSDLPAMERTVETVDVSETQAHQLELEAERVRNVKKRTTQVGALARFRRLLARLKVDGAIDAALRVLQGDERVVIWTWHRDVALKIEDALEKQGFPGFVITGQTKVDTRDLILNRWRTAKSAPLVITMSVGQVGIDLSAARHAVFAELDFTPSVVAQAEMRVFSPQRPSAITYIIIDHEIDRKILEALQTKCETAFRLGVPAAETAIDVLSRAFAVDAGSDDLQHLVAAIMADHPEVDEDDSYHGALWDHDWEADA